MAGGHRRAHAGISACIYGCFIRHRDVLDAGAVFCQDSAGVAGPRPAGKTALRHRLVHGKVSVDGKDLSDLVHARGQANLLAAGEVFHAGHQPHDQGKSPTLPRTGLTLARG